MPEIHVVGLGPGHSGLITVQAKELLLGKRPVYLRTSIHPTVETLIKWNCQFSSFDSMYEQADNFELLYQTIAEQMMLEAKQHQDIVYAVPGHPLVAETTVTVLKQYSEQHGVEVTIYPAVSCLDSIYCALNIDPTNGIQILDGLIFSPDSFNRDCPAIITQVYSKHIASEVKLTLLDIFPPDMEICVIRSAGNEDQSLDNIPLFELDRLSKIDHLTSLYIPRNEDVTVEPISYLKQVVSSLRDPQKGCPWDLEQTPMTLRKYVLEEAYEVITAIEKGDSEEICEELGDLLFQVVLQSQIAEEEELFTLEDAARSIADKLVYRHPHVFSDSEVSSPEEVASQWEELKAKEKAHQESILEDLPIALPSLSLAKKIQHKVAQVGFDWPSIQGVLDKIQEEIVELVEAFETKNTTEVIHELGDLLFILVNFARWHKIDPEDTLRQANKRFVSRFQYIEAKAKENQRELKQMTLEEMDVWWEEAKQQPLLEKK